MVPQSVIRLNRVATTLLRRFPWPIRNRFKRFPPIDTGGGASPLTLLVLGTPDRVPEAIWAAYTFLFWHPLPLRLVLAFDGPIAARSAAHIHGALPRAEIIDARPVAASMNSATALGQFCMSHTFGRKLAILNALNQQSGVIYIDSDILFYGRSETVMTEARSGTIARPKITLTAGGGYTTVGRVVDIAGARGITIPAGYNSGFFLAPRHALDAAWLDDILSQARGDDAGASQPAHAGTWDFFTEQSIVGASLARLPHDVLPTDTFVNSNDGMIVFWVDGTRYDTIVMRHFFSNVRHHLYLAGMPIAYRRMFPSHRATRPARMPA